MKTYLQVRWAVRKNESGMVLNKLNSMIQYAEDHDMMHWYTNTVQQQQKMKMDWYETLNIRRRNIMTQKRDETSRCK